MQEDGKRGSPSSCDIQEYRLIAADSENASVSVSCSWRLQSAFSICSRSSRAVPKKGSSCQFSSVCACVSEAPALLAIVPRRCADGFKIGGGGEYLFLLKLPCNLHRTFSCKAQGKNLPYSLRSRFVDYPLFRVIFRFLVPIWHDGSDTLAVFQYSVKICN